MNTWQFVSLFCAPLVLTLLSVIVLLTAIFSQRKSAQQSSTFLDKQLLLIMERLKQVDSQRDNIHQLLKEQQREQQEQRQRFDEHQINSLKLIQDSLQKGLAEVRQQLTAALNQHTQNLNERVEKLTQETSLRLKEIHQEVDRQLSKGFEKTTATFIDVVKRLAIIDEAQRKITELSGNVVSLQEILVDKKSRGAFGEVQLTSLIHNMIPESHFSLQHTLSNGKRPDCILFLPEPTGNIAIDAKFPLEYYQQLMKDKLPENELREAEQQFRLVIRKHIQSISEKYIIQNETSDGAVMFIPAEAVFAKIHADYPDLVEYAHQSHVWMVSPTTMMAILTTVRAVLKDAATRKQVHIIQEHLIILNKDFERFQKRMDDLARHIGQANQDVELVHRSSQKISRRFQRIEKVEFNEKESAQQLLEEVE